VTRTDPRSRCRRARTASGEKSKRRRRIRRRSRADAARPASMRRSLPQEKRTCHHRTTTDSRGSRRSRSLDARLEVRGGESRGRVTRRVCVEIGSDVP
jgi:hypothetical protein